MPKKQNGKPLDSEAYVFKLGLMCPNCGTNNIEGLDSVAVQEGRATQSVICNICDATWDDQYNLVGYESLTVK